jgi:hypothetical protein
MGIDFIIGAAFRQIWLTLRIMAWVGRGFVWLISAGRNRTENR